LSPDEFGEPRRKDQPFYERVMQGKILFRRDKDEITV
jgi:hypothetical protein